MKVNRVFALLAEKAFCFISFCVIKTMNYFVGTVCYTIFAVMLNAILP
jgi:hypothetical protein